jgi:endonuclease/exonuclease/phosphatase family metal-dependent hydrolase
LDADGVLFDLYNVHLLSVGPVTMRKTGFSGNFQMRAQQIDTLGGEIQRRGLPAVAMGDFNMTEANQAYGRARRYLRDAWLEVGRGPGWTWPREGFPPMAPVLRLDYCFVSPAVQPSSMRVLDSLTGSDHCAVVVDLVLPRAEGRVLSSPRGQAAARD